MAISYKQVPTDVLENLEFRSEMRHWAAGEEAHAIELWKACSRDVLFWVNTFVYTYDPRKDPNELPFICYPFQEQLFLEMAEYLGDRDFLIEKSRDQGASWIACIVFMWRWLFRRRQTFLLVSRNQDLVDKKGNPDSLFWKLKFLLDYLPRWMRPVHTATLLHLENHENGSVIDGQATTGDVARGGRRTAILLDEFAAFDNAAGYEALASTQPATKCRVFNSTPKGVGNAFFDMAHSEAIRKFRLHWSEHPEQSAGMYGTGARGKVEYLDDLWEYDPEYPYILDGKIRSPWYDGECARTPIDTIIAQELDINYLGSGSQFFDAERINYAMSTHARKPLHTGHFRFNHSDGYREFRRDSKSGNFDLWFHLDGRGDPPRDREYVIGADISSGTGASNSAFAVGDVKTGELVGLWVDPYTRPEAMADLVVAVAKWLEGPDGRGAFLIWEANGPGRQFGARVADLGYRNFYWKKNETNILSRDSSIPGWWSDKNSKRDLLTEFNRALSAGDFLCRSAGVIKECGEYVFQTDGSVDHARARSTLDPSGAKENHGDRVIAAALCWRGLRGEMKEVEGTPTEAPYMSFAWRREEWQRNRKLVSDYWSS